MTVKGLLLKDLYMLRAYCKSYLLIVVIFLAASFFGGNMFFIYYPCLLCGMIPVNLLAYDERSRFVQYSASLPVSRKQAVTEKYLMGLFSLAAVLLVTGVVQGIRMHVNGTFSAGGFAVVMLSLLVVSLLASAIPLPFVFKSGVEKGRIAYYVMIGFVCGVGILFSESFKGGLPGDVPPGAVFAALTIFGVAAYALSWYLSVRFYTKREL